MLGAKRLGDIKDGLPGRQHKRGLPTELDELERAGLVTQRKFEAGRRLGLRPHRLGPRAGADRVACCGRWAARDPEPAASASSGFLRTNFDTALAEGVDFRPSSFRPNDEAYIARVARQEADDRARRGGGAGRDDPAVTRECLPQSQRRPAIRRCMASGDLAVDGDQQAASGTVAGAVYPAARGRSSSKASFVRQCEPGPRRPRRPSHRVRRRRPASRGSPIRLTVRRCPW